MAVAPRRAAKLTVNETLRDRGVAHAVLLERLKNGEGARVAAELRNTVMPDLIDRLTRRLATIDKRGYDWDAAGTARLNELLQLVQETVDAWSSGLASDLKERTHEIGAAEAVWQNGLIQSTIPFRWDTVMPSTRILAAVIDTSPIDGVLLSDIVGRLGAGTKANLEKAIRTGIAEGETIERIRARLRRVSDFSVDTADAVARTAVGHASNLGRQAFYNDNTDLVASVLWVATLDTRTCPSCMALDGKSFPIDKGARPPRHIRCRCTTVPQLKSMSALGLNLSDFDPTTRASMNGQVAASETFGTWLAKQPVAMQDEALGPTRGKLYRTRELKVSDFVDTTGEQLNLTDLRHRERKAFAKAGL